MCASRVACVPAAHAPRRSHAPTPVTHSHKHTHTHAHAHTHTHTHTHRSTSDGIVRWVKKKTGPAAAEVADKDALAAAEKGAEVLAVGYFKEYKVHWWWCCGVPCGVWWWWWWWWWAVWLLEGPCCGCLLCLGVLLGVCVCVSMCLCVCVSVRVGASVP
jgi:hypothetical protein